MSKRGEGRVLGAGTLGVNEQQGLRLCCRSSFLVMRQGKQARKKGTGQNNKGPGKGHETLLQRAYNLHRQGRIAEAQEAYECFLSKSPGHGEALGNLGLLLHGQGQCKRAAELYQQALCVSPGQRHLSYHLGNALRELGQPEEAIAAYNEALTSEHEQSEIILNLGQAYAELGQYAEARVCFEKIPGGTPSFSQASYCLGLLFFEQEQFAAAMDCFTDVLNFQPDYVDACFNLALCHKALGQTDMALISLEKAANLAPDDADILYNIGVLYKGLGDIKLAEETFLQALEREPANGICLTDLAILYHSDNRLAEAAAMYQRALESGYRSDSALHMLAALRGETTVSTPASHIRDLFDNYASGFDQSLTFDLQYKVPNQLADIFQRLKGGSVVSTAVDLGCGTGLSGEAFQKITGHLVGVDLSGNMLALAAAKKTYDELHCSDVIEFLQKSETSYDMALATDLLVYLGELESFFEVVASRLMPRGFFLFSVESCRQGYSLRQSGRYAHGPEYIAHLATRYHFTILHQESTGIRKERGAWIPGEIYIMQAS